MKKGFSSSLKPSHTGEKGENYGNESRADQEDVARDQKAVL